MSDSLRPEVERLAALLQEALDGRDVARYLVARGVRLAAGGPTLQEIAAQVERVAASAESGMRHPAIEKLQGMVADALCGAAAGEQDDRRVGDAMHDGTPMRGLGEASVPVSAPRIGGERKDNEILGALQSREGSTWPVGAQSGPVPLGGAIPAPRAPSEPSEAQIDAALNVAPEVFVPLAPYGGTLAPALSREDVRRMLRAAIGAEFYPCDFQRMRDSGPARAGTAPPAGPWKRLHTVNGTATITDGGGRFIYLRPDEVQPVLDALNGVASRGLAEPPQ